MSLTCLRECWACGTGMDFDQKPSKCLACGADDPCGNRPGTKPTVSSNEYTLANAERLLTVAVDGFAGFEGDPTDEPSKPFAALEDGLAIIKELMAQQRNAHETFPVAEPMAWPLWPEKRAQQISHCECAGCREVRRTTVAAAQKASE